MILLDTHALLWWALDPEQLSADAAGVVKKMERDGGFASSISIWEIGIKALRGKLELGIGIDEFARRVEDGGVVEFVSVDSAIWRRSLALPWENRDPADRVIVATALGLNVPILTKDTRIREFPGIGSLW